MARLSRVSVASAIVLSACAATASSASGVNLVLNGSFENNTAGTDRYNLINSAFNSYMSNCTGFGQGYPAGGNGQIDIESNAAGSYGGNSGAGAWHICVVGDDALSMALSQALVAGQSYTVSFLARINNDFSSGTGPLRIGTSSSATAVGTEVYSTGTLTASWTRFTSTFVAGSGASFLTITGNHANDNASQSWMMVDDFSVTDAVPAPGALALLGIAGLAGGRRRR